MLRVQNGQKEQKKDKGYQVLPNFKESLAAWGVNSGKLQGHGHQPKHKPELEFELTNPKPNLNFKVQHNPTQSFMQIGAHLQKPFDNKHPIILQSQDTEYYTEPHNPTTDHHISKRYKKDITHDDSDEMSLGLSLQDDYSFEELGHLMLFGSDGENVFTPIPHYVTKLHWWNKGKQSKLEKVCLTGSERLALIYCCRVAFEHHLTFRISLSRFVDHNQESAVVDPMQLANLSTADLGNLLFRHNSLLEKQNSGYTFQIETYGRQIPFLRSTNIFSLLQQQPKN